MTTTTTTTAEPVTAQVYRIFIRATPEAIWDAITRPEFSARYFYGSRVETTGEPGTPFRHHAPASRVTWQIEPHDGGYSLLTVTHDRLENAPGTAASVSGAGWMMVLSGLKTVLETGSGLTDG